MKPCEVTCPKCGTNNVHRRFMTKGMHKEPDYGNRYDGPLDGGHTEYSVVLFGLKIIANCIFNHCRVCSYEWTTDPLTADADSDAEFEVLMGKLKIDCELQWLTSHPRYAPHDPSRSAFVKLMHGANNKSTVVAWSDGEGWWASHRMAIDLGMIDESGKTLTLPKGDGTSGVVVYAPNGSKIVQSEKGHDHDA